MEEQVATPAKESPEKTTEKHLTSIRISKETVELLKERGRKGESYDVIIRKLLQKRRR